MNGEKDDMARRKIKRKRGEGVLITGPATVHVSRRVMLIIDAPAEARIARLAKQPRTPAPPARGRIVGKHGPSPPIVVEDES